MFFASEPLRKLLFFVPVAVTSACLTALPLRRPWWLLYPFTVLYLAPEWLVVPRYYLIPLTLFLLAREDAPASSERVQTGVFALASAVLFVVVERGFGWV